MGNLGMVVLIIAGLFMVNMLWLNVLADYHVLLHGEAL